MAVGGALLRQRRRLSGGQIFEPFRRFLRSARADIDGEVRFGANLIEEVHEFVRSESVRLDHAAPVGIERHGSLFGRSDAFAPVIFVGEAAAGPANVWDFDRLERGNHVVANSARVRDFGIRTDPYAFINAVSEMLGKLAKDVAIDLVADGRDVNRQGNFVCRHSRDSRSQGA